MIDNLTGNVGAQAHINSKDIRAAVKVLTEHGFGVHEACTSIRNIICTLSNEGEIDEAHPFPAALARLGRELKHVRGVSLRLAMLQRRFGIENVTAASLLAFNVSSVVKYIGD
jgi:hypothetical protein